MVVLETLVPILLAFFIVAASPGPANIATATIAMRFGRRSALVFGAGLSVGLAFWGVIAASGLGAVLQGSAQVLFVLKILGGLYLLWLAFQSGRAALKPGEAMPARMAEGRWFMRGLMLNLSNPKAVFAWLTVLSMGLEAGDGSGLLILATLVCIALGFVNYAAHALTFSLPGFMTGYRRCQRWIDGAVAGLFSVAGFGLIRSAFQRGP